MLNPKLDILPYFHLNLDSSQDLSHLLVDIDLFSGKLYFIIHSQAKQIVYLNKAQITICIQGNYYVF